MVDNVVPTLAPQSRAPDILVLPNAQPQDSPLQTEKQALFDSIAQEGTGEEASSESSPLKTYFTAFLWSGYAIAIVVALVLVWSATKELLKALPH
jgi:hypothetical protein